MQSTNRKSKCLIAPCCFCSDSRFLEASVSCIGMVTQACSAWESGTFLLKWPSPARLRFKIVVNIKCFLMLKVVPGMQNHFSHIYCVCPRKLTSHLTSVSKTDISEAECECARGNLLLFHIYGRLLTPTAYMDPVAMVISTTVPMQCIVQE